MFDISKMYRRNRKASTTASNTSVSSRGRSQTVVATQPQKNQMLLVNVDGHRDFTTGIFGCCSGCGFVTCLCDLLCLPCTLCNIAIRINECPLMPYCVPGSVVAMRTKIRTMGGIDFTALLMTLSYLLGGSEFQFKMSNTVQKNWAPSVVTAWWPVNVYHAFYHALSASSRENWTRWVFSHVTRSGYLS